MKKIFLLWAIIGTSCLYSQNLDSLFSEYAKLVNGQPLSVQSDAKEITGMKCGTALCGQIADNFKKFTPEKQRVLKALEERPVRETSVVSPGGYFRVHYNTTGNYAPGYDLNELLVSLDSAYNFMINILQYPPPPTDNMKGGDNLYDVYLNNFTRYTYGYTQFEDSLSGDRYTSYMVIDNDFATHFTSGINGARVTVAHEFFHAIQIGNYIWRGSDEYYYEISSVSMEEFVFDDVNDYYGELKNYLRRTSRTISSISGYELGILNIFLKERYGYDIVKRIWEIMKDKDFLYAFEDAVVEQGSTFKSEFTQFGIWTFFTGENARPGYFEEADFYEGFRPVNTVEFSPPSSELMLMTAPISNSFIRFNTPTDSIIILVSNCDIYRGINEIGNLAQIDYNINTYFTEGWTKISENYYGMLSASNQGMFGQAIFLNNELVGNESVETNQDPYPLPFKYSLHNLINIPTGGQRNDEVYLNIYSTGLSLVFNDLQILSGSDGGIVTWNGRDNHGDKLPTGVYIYVVKYGDTVQKGKLVIFND